MGRTGRAVRHDGPGWGRKHCPKGQVYNMPTPRVAMECEYTSLYEEHTGIIKEYKCDRAAVSNGMCIFHDSDNFDKNEDRAASEFTKEIQRSRRDKPLYFIGCHIPPFDEFEPKHDAVIYFNGAIFYGWPGFSNLDVQMINLSNALMLEFEMINCNVKKLVMDGVTMKKSDSQENSEEAEKPFLNIHDCKFELLSMLSARITDVSIVKCEIGKLESRGCTIKGEFEMRGCDVEKSVNFDKTTFSSDCMFTRVRFCDGATFVDTTFKEFVKFYRVVFQNQKKTRFQCNLHKASFQYTNIARVWFSPDTIWDTNDEYKIFDEKSITKDKKNLEVVQSVYRDLRDNYEFHLRYDTAGVFFTREMEIKRMYVQDKDYVKKKGLFLKIRSAHFLFYKLVSNYGESLSRVLAFDALVAVGMVVHFSTVPSMCIADPAACVADIRSCLTDPIMCITDPAGWSAAATVFARMLGAPSEAGQAEPLDHILHTLGLTFLGLTLITLRRKMERRFRH